MDTVVGIDSDEVAVEGSVVNLREWQSIADHRLSKCLVLVLDDVRGIQQHRFGQPRYRAAIAVCLHHCRPEDGLVRPLLRLTHVVATVIGRLERPLVNFRCCSSYHPSGTDLAHAMLGVPAVDERWGNGQVALRTEPDEVDDRRLVDPSLPQQSIARNIRAAGRHRVIEVLALFEDRLLDLMLVVVSDFPPGFRCDRLDRQQCLHLLRFEDASCSSR